MQVVGNATKTNPGGDYRGFNYQIVIAFKNQFQSKKVLVFILTFYQEMYIGDIIRVVLKCKN